MAWPHQLGGVCKPLLGTLPSSVALGVCTARTSCWTVRAGAGSETAPVLGAGWPLQQGHKQTPVVRGEPRASALKATEPHLCVWGPLTSASLQLAGQHLPDLTHPCCFNLGSWSLHHKEMSGSGGPHPLETQTLAPTLEMSEDSHSNCEKEGDKQGPVPLLRDTPKGTGAAERSLWVVPGPRPLQCGQWPDHQANTPFVHSPRSDSENWPL